MIPSTHGAAVDSCVHPGYFVDVYRHDDDRE